MTIQYEKCALTHTPSGEVSAVIVTVSGRSKIELVEYGGKDLTEVTPRWRRWLNKLPLIRKHHAFMLQTTGDSNNG